MKHLFLILLLSTTTCISCCTWSAIKTSESRTPEVTSVAMNEDESISFFINKEYDGKSLELYKDEYKEYWLRCIKEIPISERLSILDIAKKIFTHQSNFPSKLDIIKSITAIPSHERKSVVGCAKKIITENMCDWYLADIIKSITAIPSHERKSVVGYAKKFITKNMYAWYLADNIKSITAIPSHERESVVGYAKKLFTNIIYDLYLADIIKSITTIPSHERESVVGYAKKFRTENMNHDDVAITLRATAAILVDDRESFLKFINKLCIDKINSVGDFFQSVLFYDIDGHEKAEIIKSVALIPADQRQALLVFFNALYNKARKHADKDGIICALCQIPADQRESITNITKSLIKDDTCGYQIKEIITALCGINDNNQRESIVRLSKQLFTDEVDGSDKAEIISNLYQIPADQRESVINHAKSLIADTMTTKDTKYIIIALCGIKDYNQRESIVRLSKPLFTDIMSGLEKKSIISSLCQTPADQRESVIDLANLLVTDTMGGYIISDIISSILPIPVNERRNRVTRTLDNIDLEPNNEDFKKRLIQMLETPLNQTIPPLEGGMRGVPGRYAYGINVHDLQRDSATTTAMKLLLLHQKNIQKCVFMASYKDFKKNLNTLPKNKKKSNILRALGLSGKRQTNDFGGLLTDEITVCGLSNMDPKEFLGRMWHFIETYADDSLSAKGLSTEKENAKYSLFSSLADCIEDDGHIICNPGKIQHILISVLQGRLKNVNIDGADFLPDAAFTDDIKSKLDQEILASFLKNGHVNVHNVVRLSKVTAKGAKDYIKDRLIIINSFNTNAVLKAPYTNKTILTAAKNTFLKDAPYIAENQLLKQVFELKMEEQFKTSLERVFYEFLDEFEQNKHDKDEQYSFMEAVHLYLQEHQDIDTDQFNILATEFSLSATQ